MLANEIHRRWPDLRGPGVVAVSGGADSVALLRVLSTWTEPPLVVAHVNHRFRGAESDADERFVAELAASLHLAYRSLSVDVRDEAAKSGGNLENVARKVRYDFLAGVAQESGATWVATGHTADDQAETVLHRLLRGAGMQGLRGIARERELLAGIRLVRPLLEATRGEVTAYLNQLQQPWREDVSNNDPAFTRNRIRHELMPLLLSFNPSIGIVLGRLAEQAGEIYGEEEQAAQALLAEAELPPAGQLRIFRTDRLRRAPRRQVRGMFRRLWRREGWPENDMTYDHWKRLVAVALGEETASDLPGGISARQVGDVGAGDLGVNNLSGVVQIGPRRPACFPARGGC